MALKINYKDEHGIVQIDMSPTSSHRDKPHEDITDPKFDTINSRFGQYDLFSGKYDVDSGGTPPSLFRSRYNSIEEELANTPYAFATERSLRLNSANNLDITINTRLDDISPSKDIEDDRFFNRNLNYDGLFGPEIDSDSKIKAGDSPAFTVTQLIHAQDRYFDLSSRQSIVDSPRQSINDSPRSVVKHLRDSFEVRSVPSSGKERTVKIVDNFSKRSDGAFKVLSSEVKSVGVAEPAASVAVVPTSKRKRELSFAILAETPAASRPTSPKSLPVDLRQERVSPFRGRGFREDTSRHNTPKTSAANSRASSPPRRRTNSLSRLEKMAAATLPPPVHLSRPHSPRNFLKENIEEVRGLSELNREKHEVAAEKRKIEEEEAILKEMGLSEKEAKMEAIKSVVGSRTNSRSNSPNKINLRSRSSSPAAILLYENIPASSKEFVNPDDGIPKPVTHKSRMRSVSKSQPQSNDGSPKHSKIPKRQNSVSPKRTGTTKRDISISRRPVENNLNRNQRFISNSTSSIHETIKIGSQVHDKRAMSKSTQHLNISPAVKGKPPISPGRGGPPPANKSINAKRLSPIVGTPSKSPVDDLKPGSAKTSTKPSPIAKKSVKTAGNTPASSRLNSRQPSRAVSREPSPDKRNTTAKTNGVNKTVNGHIKPITRVSSTKTTQKPSVSSKTEPKKPISRASSIKSLTRTPSTKNLNEKPPVLQKRDSKKDLTEKAQSTSKLNEVGTKKDSVKGEKKTQKDADKSKDLSDKSSKKGSNEDIKKKCTDSSTEVDEIITQDNETQYDKITNEKGELVILTKKNIVSMTTAAITSQPLEVVTTVTNQLPAAFEKAREKGIFERLGSKDSLALKDTKDIEKETEPAKTVTKEPAEKKDKSDEKVPPKPSKLNHEKVTLFVDDHVKLRPLQPPYNNPQVERVRQKIDDLFKEPEVSRENILTASAKSREMKTMFKNIADKTKNEVKETKEAKDEIAQKMIDIKNQAVKHNEKITAEIRSEVTKIVDSIITPVEEPNEVKEKEKKNDMKENIEPIVMVVNEKKKNGPALKEKMNEALVKGEAEVEVQSSNVSTPGVEKLAAEKKTDGNGSDKSAQSNGGFPQSTSTTPKPPARTKKEGSKDKSPTNEPNQPPEIDEETQTKKPNICQRLMGKCKSKCCSCCVKGETDDDEKQKDGKREMEDKKETTDAGAPVEKKGMISKFNCCKKKEDQKRIEDIERAAGKASIEFENEVKRKRKLRDVLCGCCGSRRRVSDVSEIVPSNAADIALTPGVVGDTGCCGKKRAQIERRDSILSDRPPTSCCNNRLCTWLRGMTRRRSEHSTSRRPSLFSKNKSMSPTLPPEDTRKKLDTSLVEHTSVMRGAIPVLPLVLACFCLFCNVVIPGLGTIFSGLFCLCFGIPRFGVHDGAKYRIGAFVINLLVGCGQLFTVLFCLVGWGWSIWWGVIMFKISRKYRKLKAEARAEEAEAAPPVTANNHTRA